MKNIIKVISVVSALVLGSAAVNAAPFQIGVWAPDVQLVSSSDNVKGLRLNFVYVENQNVSGVDLFFVGFTKGEFNGVSLTLAEVVGGEANGVIWSFFNKINGGCGWQGAALTMNEGSFTGLQTAFVNWSATTTGVQLGFVNMAKSFKGLQLGFVNVADSLNGLQIGLVNVAKNSDLFWIFPIVNFAF